MTRSSVLRTFLAAVLLTAGIAFAQVDPQAKALIESLASQSQAAEIQSLDQTMVMTLHGGEEPLVTTSRIVVDYPGKRAAIVSEVMGMSTTMRSIDGVTTMSMNGMTMPLPPNMDSSFDGIFESGATGDLLADPDAVITYDGQVSYADVLSGQQVSYTGDFGVPGMQMDSTTIRFVFDDAGRLLGQVVPENGSDLVSVYVGEPHIPGALFYDVDMYQVTASGSTLYATMRYENIAFNEPLDESVFE